MTVIDRWSLAAVTQVPGIHNDVLLALLENGGRLEDALTVMLDQDLTNDQIWQGEWLRLFPIKFRSEAVALLATLRADHREYAIANPSSPEPKRRARIVPDVASAMRAAVAVLRRQNTQLTWQATAAEISASLAAGSGTPDISVHPDTLRKWARRDGLPHPSDPFWSQPPA